MVCRKSRHTTFSSSSFSLNIFCICSVIKKEAEICVKCGVRQNKLSGSSNRKNKITAGILAILLGSLGIHKFYLDSPGLGVLYLCFSWSGIPGIIGIIEGVLYLVKTDEEFAEKYC